MVFEFGYIIPLQLRRRHNNCLRSLERFIARADRINGTMSTDISDSNDDLESYALFERQHVLSCVVRFFVKHVGQGAAKHNDCKGLSLERPSNSADQLYHL